MLRGALAPWHLVLVALVFMVLFGSKRLPDSARALGKSLRIFKAEMHALKDDEPDNGTGSASQSSTTPMIQAAPTQVTAPQPDEGHRAQR